jgi:hypothetical protein
MLRYAKGKALNPDIGGYQSAAAFGLLRRRLNWLGGTRNERGRQLRRSYSSQTRSPQSHSNARMTACLSGKCTVLINFSVAPQMRHSRLELPSVSPIFSALNISIGHPRVPIPEFLEKVAIVKLGHCQNQIRH